MLKETETHSTTPVFSWVSKTFFRVLFFRCDAVNFKLNTRSVDARARINEKIIYWQMIFCCLLHVVSFTFYCTIFARFGLKLDFSFCETSSCVVCAWDDDEYILKEISFNLLTTHNAIAHTKRTKNINSRILWVVLLCGNFSFFALLQCNICARCNLHIVHLLIMIHKNKLEFCTFQRLINSLACLIVCWFLLRDDLCSSVDVLKRWKM